MVKAQQVTIEIFEGDAWDVEMRVNTALRVAGPDAEIAFMLYNYQAAEYHEDVRMAPPSHGVLLALAKGEASSCA